MLNHIKESFNLTNKYIILATPLILFSLLSSLYVLFSIGGNSVSLVIAAVLFFLMLAAFLSGWFFMIKTAVTEDREDSNSLFKEFPSGVGEYFLPVAGLIITIFFVSIILLAASYACGMKFIGDIGVSAGALSKAAGSVGALKTFMLSLTPEQLFRLNAWNLLLFGTMTLTYFIIIFYAPVMFFKEKNPLKAYFISLKDLFGRKFFGNFSLFLIIFVTYFVLSVLTAVLSINPVMHFIFTLTNFYYMVFAAVFVFEYYYSNFVKIGAIVDKTV